MGMANWGDDLQPCPVRRHCAACGGSFRHIDPLGLCVTCREEYDEESAALEAQERADEDAAARRAYYNG